MPGVTHGPAILLRPEDNVAVAARRLERGAQISLNPGAPGIEANEVVNQGHKIAIKPIKTSSMP